MDRPLRADIMLTNNDTLHVHSDNREVIVDAIEGFTLKRDQIAMMHLEVDEGDGHFETIQHNISRVNAVHQVRNFAK